MSKTSYGIIKYSILYMLVLFISMITTHLIFGSINDNDIIATAVTGAFMVLTYQIQEKNGE